MRHLLTASFGAATLSLLLAGPASAVTLTAVTTNASVDDPTAWAPPQTPVDGDTLVVQTPNTIVNVTRDLRLAELQAPDTIVRLSGDADLVVAAPTTFKNLTVSGTTGYDNRLVVSGQGSRFEGVLKLLNGAQVFGEADLVFAGVAVQNTGSPTTATIPNIRLHWGSARVMGPMTLSGQANALRPMFDVGMDAQLVYDADVTQNGLITTRSTGKVIAEGGASLGRVESNPGGSFEVRAGASSREVRVDAGRFEGSKLSFVQGGDGRFPFLSSPAPIDTLTTSVKPVVDPTADHEAAPQQQGLVDESTPFGGPDTTFGMGRIDLASTWVASEQLGNRIVVTRRALTVDPLKRAHIAPMGAVPVGTKLECVIGDYSYPATQVGVTFHRDGVQVAANDDYVVSEADRGHELTCKSTVADTYDNQLAEDGVGTTTVADVVAPDPGMPETPATPSTPTGEAPTGTTPAPATPQPLTPAPAAPATPATPAAPASPATQGGAKATPAAPAAPARALAVRTAELVASPSTPVTCPTAASLTDVTSAWKSADGRRTQGALTGSAAPGVWRCRIAGTQDGQAVVLRSLPVLVANHQRAMLDRETVQAKRLANPTLLSSGTQRISARLYARGGDAKLAHRTTRFTQTVKRGENAVRFTQNVGSALPKGRYKLVVRAITADGVSAPLVQEVTIG